MKIKSVIVKSILVLMFILFVSSYQSLIKAAPTPVISFEENGGSEVASYTLANNTFIFDENIGTPNYYRMEDVVAGDLDGDGDEDVVVSGWGDPVLVYEADSNQLQPYVIADNYVLARDTAIFDANHDGTNDIVLLERLALNIYVHDGNFGFTETVLHTSTAHLNAMAIGDLNNDNDEDFVIFNGDYELIQILSDGSGGYLTPTVLLTISGYATHIEIIDVNNDGINDVIYNKANSSDPMKYLEGENDGTYVENGSNEIIENVYTTPYSYHYHFEFADMDGDGIKDLFVFDQSYNGEGYAWTKRNADGSFEDDGEGGYVIHTIELSFGSKYAYVLEDVDGDNDLDFTNFQEYNNPIYIYKNDGTGTFSAPSTVSVTSATQVTYTDYNNDGTLDLINVDYNNERVRLYLGSGANGYLLSNIESTTKTGYTFGGWYTDSNLTTPFNSSSIITSDITLYAKWNIRTFYIYFNGNGATSGNTSAQLFEWGVEQNLTASSYLKTGYDFAGWNTSSNGSGDAYSNEELTSFERTSNLYYLYAQWELSSYDIVFDSNSGTGTMENQSFEYTTSADLENVTFTKTGYTFVEWNTESDGSGTSYSNQAEFTMPLDGDTLYAQWQINTYTIKFIDYDGTVLQTADYDYNADLSGVTPPTDPTRIGYTFNGWDDIVPATMTSNNITITALYTIDQYTVEFVDYDGTVLQTANYDYNADLNGVTPPTDPTRIGYTFSGWDDVAPATMGLENITITALYTINQYTIEFLDHDGTVLQSSTHDFGSSLTSLTLPIDPTRIGYTFSGWDTTVPTTMPSNNVIITAEYSVNGFTLSFVDYDGTVLQTENYDYNADLSGVTPPTVSRTGYTFDGWDITVPSTMPNSAVVITATWVDSEVPLITLNGTDITLELGTNYTDLGATCIDNEDGECTLDLIVVSTVEFNKVGEYTVTYNYTDAQGNIAIEVIRNVTVEDTISPVITGVEDNKVYESGSEVVIEFNEGTATLNGNPLQSGDKVTEPGTYQVIVTDESGNTATRSFEIESSSTLLIILSASGVGVIGIGAFILKKTVL